MGCWTDKDNPCGRCFGCWEMMPDLITTSMKLWNGTAITSINVYQDLY